MGQTLLNLAPGGAGSGASGNGSSAQVSIGGLKAALDVGIRDDEHADLVARQQEDLFWHPRIQFVERLHNVAPFQDGRAVFRGLVKDKIAEELEQVAVACAAGV